MKDKHGGANDGALLSANTNNHAYYYQKNDSENAGRQWEGGEFIVEVCACCGGRYCGRCDCIEESSCRSDDRERLPGELQEVDIIPVVGRINTV